MEEGENPQGTRYKIQDTRFKIQTMKKKKA